MVYFLNYVPYSKESAVKILEPEELKEMYRAEVERMKKRI